MAFKTKKKSRQIIDDRQTLDAKHNNILQLFTENKNSISDLQIELNNIISVINDLNIENAKSPILNLALQKKIWEYDDRKQILEETINRIDNNIDETEYMLKTGKLLSNYYKIINDEKQIASSESINYILNSNYDSNYNIDLQQQNSNKLNDQNYNNVNNNVNNKNNENNNDNENNDNENNDNETNEDINENNNKNNNENNDNDNDNYNDNYNDNDNEHDDEELYSNDFNDILKPQIKNKLNNKFKNAKKDLNNIMNNTTVYNKDTIYEKYMLLIDKNYINVNNDNIDVFDTCSKCMIEMLLNNNTGQLICPSCGMMENIIVDSDKPSFKEPPKEMTSFCYKRINHLNEFLAQFQAKETTDIPEDVYNEILMEIKKERITNMAVITPDKMRILLKKIKKNDYYEHIPYIINQLNGLPAPVIAPEIEEIIRGMFKAIQIPFEKYCPQKRKNFLSYNYVMYKFFELLELDEYLNCFQLLKSRTKLHQQDEIWKNICKDLNWEYIKSL